LAQVCHDADIVVAAAGGVGSVTSLVLAKHVIRGAKYLNSL